MYARDLLTPERELQTMRIYNFGGVQTEWMPFRDDSQGITVETQKQMIEHLEPKPKDFGGKTHQYYAQVNKFYHQHKYKKIALNAKWPLWGTQPGWILKYPTLGNTVKYFHHNSIRFRKKLLLKNDTICGIMRNYSVQSGGFTTNPDYSIDVADVHMSKIPSFDFSGKQFDWSSNQIWSEFIRSYEDINVRLQLRHSVKGWYISGIQYDKLYWNPRTDRPIWIDL